MPTPEEIEAAKVKADAEAKAEAEAKEKEEADAKAKAEADAKAPKKVVANHTIEVGTPKKPKTINKGEVFMLEPGDPLELLSRGAVSLFVEDEKPAAASVTPSTGASVLQQQ
jgi:hypothetical protein